MAEPYSYRADKNIPVFPDDKPIILFDSECVLCSGFVQFILRHDKNKTFRLLGAQTPLGAALYAHYGLHATDYETNILIDNGMAWFKSEGSIRIFERLGFPWSLVVVFRVLPLRLRNFLYDIVATHRITWFGRRACFVPGPADADRFLSQRK